MRSITCLIFLCTLLLAGCVLTQIPSELAEHKTTLQKAPEDTPAAFVTIRYPIRFSKDAEAKANAVWADMSANLYNRNVTKQKPAENEGLMSSSRPKTNKVARPDFKSPASLSAFKSHYFALELYAALTKIVPSAKIVLQPQEVVLDDKGAFAYSATTTVPSVLLVDLFVHVGEDLAAPWTTQGQRIRAFLSVRTSAQAAEKTKGALFDTVVTNQPYSVADAAAMLAGGVSAAAGRDIVQYLNTTGEVLSGEVVPYNGTWPPKLEGVYRLRELSFDMDPVGFAGQCASLPQDSGQARTPGDLGAPPSGFETSPSYPFSSVLANVVAEYVNRIDCEKAIQADLASYVEQFDAPLAEATRSGTPPTAAQQQRLAALTGFLKIELEYLERQGRSAYAVLYNDNFGLSLRRLQCSEHTAYERRKQEEAQAAAMFLAAFASAAGAASSRNSAYTTVLAGTAATTLVAGLAFAESADAGVKDFTNAYGSNMQRISEMTVMGEKLQAGTHKELREKLRAIYTKVYSRG